MQNDNPLWSSLERLRKSRQKWAGTIENCQLDRFDGFVSNSFLDPPILMLLICIDKVPKEGEKLLRLVFSWLKSKERISDLMLSMSLKFKFFY